MPNLNARPLFLFFLAVFISAVVFLLVHKTIEAQSRKEQVMAKIAQFPSKLPFQSLDSFSYPAFKQASILFYFHPQCDHCSYEAGTIQKQLDAFSSTQLIWVSEADSTSIRHFAQDHQLDQAPNVHWMSDTADVFARTFGSSSVPSVWIYSQDGQLLKHYKGETKPAALLKYLHHEPKTRH